MGEQPESTYGRRDIIKKTAVAGAVAWTAPVIVSSRALAADPSPGGCSNFYVVKIDGSPTGGTLHCAFPAGYRQLTDTAVIASVITGSHTDPTGGSFTLANTVTLVQVVGKKRDDECNVANDPTALTPFSVTPLGNNSFSVPNSDQSHIMVVFCSDLDLGGRPAPSYSTVLGPVEQNSLSITEEPVEQPVEEPVEQPVEEPVEQPVEEPVEQPVEG